MIWVSKGISDSGLSYLRVTQESPILQVLHVDCKVTHCLFLLDSAFKEYHTCFRTQQSQTPTLSWVTLSHQMISFPKPGPRESLPGNPHLSRAGGRGAGRGSSTQAQGSRLCGKWVRAWRRNGEKRRFYLTVTVNMYNLYSLLISYSNIRNLQVIWELQN